MAKKIAQPTSSQTSTSRVASKRTTKQNPSEIKKTLPKGTPTKKPVQDKISKKGASSILEIREPDQAKPQNSQKSARLSQKARQNSQGPETPSKAKGKAATTTHSKDLAKKTASTQKNTLLSFMNKTKTPVKTPATPKKEKTEPKSPEKKPVLAKEKQIEEVIKEVPEKPSVEPKV